MKNKDKFDSKYKDLIFKIGYFRNKNNLSARDTSLRLGYSESFMNRIETYKVELKVSTLLKFLELVEISVEEFFYTKPEDYKKDKELFDIIKGLSDENKETILNLAKKLVK